MLLVLLLAGCVDGADGLPPGYAVADDPLPPEVAAALPAGFPRSDVLMHDACYYLRQDGQIRPLVIRELLPEGLPDQPFCLG